MWPTLPRESDGDEVIGCVTKLDEANVVASVGADGMPWVRAANTQEVPVQRAADIQRALRAVVGYLALLAAHEIGHLLGLATGPRVNAPSAGFGTSDESVPAGGIDMPDGTVAMPPLSQDPGGHDP